MHPKILKLGTAVTGLVYCVLLAPAYCADIKTSVYGHPETVVLAADGSILVHVPGYRQPDKAETPASVYGFLTRSKEESQTFSSALFNKLSVSFRSMARLSGVNDYGGASSVTGLIVPGVYRFVWTEDDPSSSAEAYMVEITVRPPLAEWLNASAITIREGESPALSVPLSLSADLRYECFFSDQDDPRLKKWTPCNRAIFHSRGYNYVPVRMMFGAIPGDSVLVPIGVVPSTGTWQVVAFGTTLTLAFLVVTVLAWRTFGRFEQLTAYVVSRGEHLSGIRSTLSDLSTKHARSPESLASVNASLEELRVLTASRSDDLKEVLSRIDQHVQEVGLSLGMTETAGASASAVPGPAEPVREAIVAGPVPEIPARMWSHTNYTCGAGRSALRTVSADVYRSRTLKEAVEKWKSFLWGLCLTQVAPRGSMRACWKNILET